MIRRGRGQAASVQAGDRRTRLVAVLPTLYCGGTEGHVLQLGEALDPSRFKWEVACLRRRGPLVEEIERRAVPLREYQIATFRHGRAIGRQACLARDLLRTRAQIVHAYGFYGNVFAVPPARLVAPVVIASIRDCGTHLSEMQRRLQRHVCRFADCVLVNAEAVKDWLASQGYDPQKITVIRNGVDLRLFRERPQPDRVRHQFGFPQGAPLVAVVARLTPLKGLEYFLRAAAFVAVNRPESRFVIVGESAPSERDYEERLKGLARHLGLEGRLIFAGLRSDVPHILAGATVSVLPSLSEALPNAVLESMAAGTPVVATRVGGTAEAVTDGVTGLLVAPREAQALAGSILHLLDDHELATRISGAARQEIARRFSLDRMVEATEQLYDELLAKTWRRRHGTVSRATTRRDSSPGLLPQVPSTRRRLESCRWYVKAALASGISRAHAVCLRVTPPKSYRPLILGYHRIVESFEAAVGTEIPGMLTSVRMFERHLDWIGRQFRVVSLDEIGRHIAAGEPFDEPVAAVTFDDGYREVYEHAYPLLLKKGMPAAVFVVTDLLGTSAWQVHDRLYHLIANVLATLPDPRKTIASLLSELELPAEQLLGRPRQLRDGVAIVNRWLPNLPRADIDRVMAGLEAFVGKGGDCMPSPLDWALVKQMRRAGFTIGSHTRSHASLPVESPDVVAAELQGSKHALERELGEPVEHFAYPDGQFNRSVVDALAHTGYRFGYTSCSHGDPRHPALTQGRLLLWEGSATDTVGRFWPAVLNCQVHHLWPPARRCARVHSA